MITVRAADISLQADADFFICLINSYISDEMGGGRIFSGERSEKLLSGLRQHPAKLILYAEKEGLPVGMTVSFIGYSTFRACPLLNIHDIIVFPEYRGQGVGKRLMAETEARAAALGCGKISLEVRNDNHKARKLYQSLGFGECDPPMSFWVKHIEVGKFKS